MAQRRNGTKAQRQGAWCGEHGAQGRGHTRSKATQFRKAEEQRAGNDEL